MVHLDDKVLQALAISPADVVAAIEHAARQVAAGTLWTAPKASVAPDGGRYVMTTLAVSDDPALVVVKCAMVAPDNLTRGLPAINSTILLMHSQTGILLAVLGANWITAVRTAGLSAVMAKRLANPASASIAFIGSGIQARSHLDAFADMFALHEVRVIGRGRANIDGLCAYAADKGIQARKFGNARDAISDADIIISSITLNYGVAPFLDARWLKAGAFAAVTDLAIPWAPAGMSAFGRIYVDDQAQEAAMDRPIVSPELISGDLVSAVTQSEPVKFDPKRSSAFVFRGLAIGDLAVAALAYARCS